MRYRRKAGKGNGKIGGNNSSIWNAKRIGNIQLKCYLQRNQAFQYIGDAAFTGSAGELSARVINGGTLISGDVNGDKIADFAILLDDSLKLTADSFIL